MNVNRTIQHKLFIREDTRLGDHQKFKKLLEVLLIRVESGILFVLFELFFVLLHWPEAWVKS